MNKLDMESKDIINDHISKLKELFPNIITEGKIDFDMLKQELSDHIVDDKKEKYQLTWPGKKEAIVNANTPINKTLRPIKDKSVDFYNTENIYIEGDNLEALKILQESYLNKIKCIYIDPPYNTGNDFIYNDSFSKSTYDELKESGQIDEEGNRLVNNTSSNGRFHSDWLSMMYSRLKLARNLLAENGVIFISIDDNEQANLKKICDEIFGENSFYGELVQLKGNTQNDSKTIQKNHEYILVYIKNNTPLLLSYNNGVKKEVFEDEYYLGRDTSLSSGHDTLIERANFLNKKYGYYNYYINNKNNKFIHAIAVMDYNKKIIKNNSKEEEIYTDIQEILDLGYKKIRPPKRKGEKLGCWTWGIESFKNYWNENKVLIKNYKNVIKKEFVSEKEIFFDKSGKKYFLKQNILPIKSVINITNSSGTSELKGDNGLIPGIEFSNPKSVELLKYLIEKINDSNITVLDFFSGSATTAQAVMQLNSEDNGNRKFIMVQIPEETKNNDYKTICEIGEERIRRASKKIKEETNANIDYGFRVYKIDSSNMKDIYYKSSDITQANLFDYMSNIKDDRTSEDLLTQVMLDLGLTLDLKIEEKIILNNKVYFVEGNSLVACFDEEIDIVDEICKCNPMKVVFKDTSFKTDKDKINLEEKIKKLSPDTEVSVL